MIKLKQSASTGETVRIQQSNILSRALYRLYKERALWLLALPGILWYLIFAYAPMYGLVIAFQNYSPARGMFGGPWVGFEHFISFFSSQFAWRVVRNTVLLSVYGIIFGFPVPIFLAIMLNEVKVNWFKRFAQSVSYLPHFISVVIVVGMVVNFVSPEGIINQAIVALGGESRNFLIMPEWFRTIFISSVVWQTAGWGSIIYLAAISGIDPELYEAATVDGASRIKQIRHVTIPCLLPTITILLILNVGTILSVGFERVLLLYNPATFETADVIATFVFRRGIGGGEFSYGAAVGMFQSVVNLLLVVSANAISRKVSETSLW